jgi:hypothetical protein
VRPDPIPNNRVSVADTDGPITDADARRIEGWIGMDLLEMKARMGWVLPEQPISFSCLSLNMSR